MGEKYPAWTLLKGIMVLVICVSLVYLLHMDTLIFIVNRGIDIAITAAIVIFQPELRRVLERIGEKRSSLHCFRSIRTM